MDEKKKAYTRPWFWLLIVLIVSVIIKAAENAERVEQLLSVGDNSEQEYITASSEDITEEPEQTVQESDTIETAAEKTADNNVNIFHFIMNKSTKKYHTTQCSAAAKITESKREETDIEANSVEEAKQILEQQGYTPCTRCCFN